METISLQLLVSASVHRSRSAIGFIESYATLSRSHPYRQPMHRDSTGGLATSEVFRPNARTTMVRHVDAR